MGGTVGVATQLAYARQRAGVEEASWTLRSCQKNQGGGGQWKGSHSHSNWAQHRAPGNRHAAPSESARGRLSGLLDVRMREWRNGLFRCLAPRTMERGQFTFSPVLSFQLSQSFEVLNWSPHRNATSDSWITRLKR